MGKQYNTTYHGNRAEFSGYMQFARRRGVRDAGGRNSLLRVELNVYSKAIHLISRKGHYAMRKYTEF
jgi:hypothetical protein